MAKMNKCRYGVESTRKIILMYAGIADTSSGENIPERSRSDLHMDEEKLENGFGYICLYRGKKFEVHAESTFDAQQKCAKENNIKKRYEISVYLAEKNGKPVIHTPDF
jgi:hypothetical protein